MMWVMASASSFDETQPDREKMVRDQIIARGVRDPVVLQAMRMVPRHEFVPSAVRNLAYEDSPLPIGEGQTISQPYIVALMTELADLRKGERVLEVGTGSGYQAAVLAEVGATVYSIEILSSLAQTTKVNLKRLGYGRIFTRIGDGYRGWSEAAPFHAIVVTAAPPKIPEPLKQQLAVGGKMVIPVGGINQNLLVITRTLDGFSQRTVIPVRFVPMTGKAQES
jgi:protein-L-isoaspartate(D-aspartate) O-methyltransferase